MARLRVGIMGCGGIAAVMAGTLLKMKDASLYAVASRTEEKAREFSQRFGKPKAYGSYAAMLEDPAVDLVYIATPHSAHAENIRLCVEHGKAVLCEKAFTANARQAEEVLGFAESRHVLVTEAMWVRYMPMAKTLRELIASGCIGTITTCTANLHYDIDSHDRLVNPALAGGALLDVGVYTLTFASIAMGDDVGKICASAIISDRGIDRQDAAALSYRGGQMAVLSCGMSAVSDRLGILYGRSGYIIVTNVNNFERISVYSKDRELVKSIDAPEQISGYEYEVEACARALASGAAECPEMPHAETIAIMKQMDEIRRQTGVVYPFEQGA